jgi:hypothetical protein
MRRTVMGVSLVCPNCNQPVDLNKPNVIVSRATKQVQHTDCWARTAKAADSDPAPSPEPKSPSHTA